MPRIVPRVGPRGHRYTLTLHGTGGHGSIVADPDCADYAANTRVQLTAVPIEGWEFWYWRAHLSGSENPATLVMSSNRTVTAQFRREAE